MSEERKGLAFSRDCNSEKVISSTARMWKTQFKVFLVFIYLFFASKPRRNNGGKSECNIAAGMQTMSLSANLRHTFRPIKLPRESFIRPKPFSFVSPLRLAIYTRFSVYSYITLYD